MAFDVKNTKFKCFWEIICPYHCMACGKLGQILCECCKNYIISGHVNYCLKCGIAIKNGVCKSCALPYLGAWTLGRKDGILGEMAEKLKYGSVRDLAGKFAEMLAAIIPCLGTDAEVKLVPLPTLARHVRVRGLDHTKMIAKNLASLRGWELAQIVKRVRDSVQVGASANLRKKQAKEAYKLDALITKENTYLVLDDIYTTGASIKAVCDLLKNAGANKVFVVLVAKS